MNNLRTSISYFILLFFCQSICYSQLNYAIDRIPDSLLQDAKAVVRQEKTIIIIESSRLQKINYTKVKSILSNGSKSIEFSVGYDKSIKIKSLQLNIYDAKGKLIEEISKKKFQDFNASGSNLFDHNRLKHYEYFPKTYPITYALHYEQETSNTAFIPKWQPVDLYETAVEESSFTILCPDNLGLHTNEYNIDIPQVQKIIKGNSIQYTCNDMVIIPRESYAVNILSITPTVRFSLTNFHLEGIDGTANNWNEFGRWCFTNLLETQANLSASVKAEIVHLTQQAETEIEKAKIIYKYVQSRTRYISIQMGIGGWMPFSAEDVHQLGYGDCKALTNYTKSLLSLIDIESFYCPVYSGKEMYNIQGNSSMQGNHAILCIPKLDDNQDSVWLECTSKNAPFGYIGDFTDDRDVLLISEEGGKIVHTTTYDETVNILQTSGKIIMTESDKAHLEIEKSYRGIYFDKYQMNAYTTNDKLEFYKNEWSAINVHEILEIKNEIQEDDIQFLEKLKFTANQLFQKGGSDLLYPIIPISNIPTTPKRIRKRKTPFQIKRGIQVIDEFEFQVPAKFKISSELKSIDETGQFGSYTLSMALNDNTLTYKRTFTLFKNTYDKDSYKAFRSFLKKCNEWENIKLLLQKST